ncbi:YpjP family protein [Halobacillus litoralis]|uniref:YpjP family protein n=1 Tax=Halobacillus litoralis TaxID=45668 RepID=UPI001CD7329A|nr:YpjP family protein [Halobacillus litoralis]MCA1024067.1 YpjP family protein [Halobacillus litoralis]
MKPLMRRIFVVLISVLTLGLYIPPAHVDAEAAEKKEITDAGHLNEPSVVEDDQQILPDVLTEDRDEDPFRSITEEAFARTEAKMGPRIMEKVDDELSEVIFPEMEKVMVDLLSNTDEEHVPYMKITEDPAPGYGERMFNLYNGHTDEEIARFHVRRDKRPGEGYWFNFHYHLKEDAYAKHHEIGEIYWEKNTPPKWMS